MNMVSSVPVASNVVSYPGAASAALRRAMVAGARDVADSAFASAGVHDVDGAYPAAEVTALHETGLLTAPLPLELGGADLDGSALCEV